MKLSQISNKIKPKILKVINKFPTQVTVYRDILNEFNEPDDQIKVCDITGFYHEGNRGININLGDNGKVKKDKSKYLMVIVDEVSKNIQENDYLYIENIKYNIVDKGNQNNLDIYYDMVLERS